MAASWITGQGVSSRSSHSAAAGPDDLLGEAVNPVADVLLVLVQLQREPRRPPARGGCRWSPRRPSPPRSACVSLSAIGRKITSNDVTVFGSEWRHGGTAAGRDQPCGARGRRPRPALASGRSSTSSCAAASRHGLHRHGGPVPRADRGLRCPLTRRATRSSSSRQGAVRARWSARGSSRRLEPAARSTSATPGATCSRWWTTATSSSSARGVRRALGIEGLEKTRPRAGRSRRRAREARPALTR